LGTIARTFSRLGDGGVGLTVMDIPTWMTWEATGK
jgi:hypothetical protein